MIPRIIHSLFSRLTGKNSASTPPDVIIDQMNEPRPLPMGMTDFEAWSTRIISGALIPGGDDEPDKFRESQVFALANMLMHLGPTESHKPDAFFIHSLRKFAINQIADAVRKELHAKAKARTAAEEEAQKTEAQKAAEEAAAATLKRIADHEQNGISEAAKGMVQEVS
jgi:hypothetical protein